MSHRPAVANRRLIMFVVGVAAVVAALWMAGSAVLPFALGLVFAYFVAPLVNKVDRALRAVLSRPIGAWPPVAAVVRPSAIVVVYVLCLGAIVGAVVVLSVPLAREGAEIRSNWPEYAERGEQLLGQAAAWYETLGVAPAIETELQAVFTRERLEQVGVGLLELLRDGLVATFATLASTMSFLVASIVVPFWLFYILNDTGRVMRSAIAFVPREIRPDVDALRIIVDRVLSGYIRGQLIIAFILGLMVAIGLLLVGLPYAVTLGVFAGAFGIIPFVGAIIGALPAVLLAALQGPAMVVKVLIVFIVIQQIDSLLVSPRVQGDSVSLHPGVIMVVVVLGQALLGFIGLVIAVPLTAVLRDVFHYIYLRAGEEPCGAAEAMTMVGYGDQLSPIVCGEEV